MKHKISSLYLGAFLYRFVFLLLAVPIEAVLFEGFSPVFVFFTYFTNIAIFLLLVVWGILSLKATTLEDTQGKIHHKEGILLRKTNSTYRDKISCVTLTRKLLYLPFRSVKISLKGANHIAEAYLKTSDGKRLSHRLMEKGERSHTLLHAPNFLGLLLICAGFSNVLWGLFTLIPVLTKTANIIGEERTSQLIELFKLESDLLLFLIPSSLRILAGFFFLLWFLGLLSAFIKRLSFSLKMCGDTLTVQRGIITKTITEFHQKSMSAVTLRQSLLLLIFKRFSLHAHLPVKGSERFLSLTLAEKEKKQREIIDNLGFAQTKPTCTLRLKGFPLWGYCYKALLFLAFILLLLILPINYPLLFYPWVALFLSALIWLFFSFLGFRKSRVTVYGDYIVLHHASPFHLCKTYIPKDKIMSTQLVQSPYQRFRGSCTLKIYIKSESKTSFKIISLDKKEATQLNFS